MELGSVERPYGSVPEPDAAVILSSKPVPWYAG